MKCLKIPHHRLIYSLFASFLFSFFLSFGLSHDSYATSVNCTASNQIASGNSITLYPTWDFCDSSLSMDKQYYMYDINFHVVYNNNVTIPTNGIGQAIVINPSYTSTSGSLGYYSMPTSNRISSPGTYDITFDDIVISAVFAVTNIPNTGDYGWFLRPSIRVGVGGSSNTNYIDSYTLTYKYTDDLSDITGSSGSSEPCPVCPVIPDNPYDNKFDAITKAIYTCGAVLIMLYFFFCIYKIIVKDGGSR